MTDWRDRRIELLEMLLTQVSVHIKPKTPEGFALSALIVDALTNVKAIEPCAKCKVLSDDLERFKKVREEIWKLVVTLKTSAEQKADRDENSAIAEADLRADLGLELP